MIINKSVKYFVKTTCQTYIGLFCFDIFAREEKMLGPLIQFQFGDLLGMESCDLIIARDRVA
jgi:hypothetical protein